jgi:hypothetical protein
MFTACQQQAEQKVVVAKAYDYNLYLDELKDVLPDNVHGQDSIIYAQTYINQWLFKKVELYHAEMNIKQENIDFERQIEDYRNSLLIYEYQKRVVAQKLDTVVSDDEIQEYYLAHKMDFTLKRNIVQVSFLKIPIEDKKNIAQVKKLLRSYKEEDKPKLKDIAEHIAVNYLLDDDMWIFFDDLTKEIPIKTYNQVSFLRNNRVVVEHDSLYSFLLRINNFKIADSTSPIEFEYDRIRSIIINIRKLDLIQRMKKELFLQAQEEGKVEILN